MPAMDVVPCLCLQEAQAATMPVTHIALSLLQLTVDLIVLFPTAVQILQHT